MVLSLACLQGMVLMVTMERRVRPSLKLWFPGHDRDDDYRVSRMTAKAKFLLAHRTCCLSRRCHAGSCKGDRFEDAGRSSNYHHGAAFESVAVELASLDAAFDALGQRLRRGALCLIKRGASHVAPDGKFLPGQQAAITWGALARFYRVRKQTLMDDAQEAAEAIALQMLDWVKVELPEPTPAA